MKKIVTRSILCIAVLAATLTWAYAQFEKPQDAIQYRQSAMVLIASHFKRLGAVVQGKADYDQSGFSQNAEVLKVLAGLPWEACLEPGSDKGETTLSAAVFDKKDDFLELASSFEKSTASLAQLASAGDLEGSKAQFGAVAADCKSCHSQFRSR